LGFNNGEHRSSEVLLSNWRLLILIIFLGWVMGRFQLPLSWILEVQRLVEVIYFIGVAGTTTFSPSHTRETIGPESGKL